MVAIRLHPTSIRHPSFWANYVECNADGHRVSRHLTVRDWAARGSDGTRYGGFASLRDVMIWLGRGGGPDRFYGIGLERPRASMFEWVPMDNWRLSDPERSKKVR